MKSQWYEYKHLARQLRASGESISFIEKKLGIPRSTLSGWFRDIRLTEEQRQALEKRKLTSLANSRHKASAWHKAQKEVRLIKARQTAETTLANIAGSKATLELALAMLYLGEGRKSQTSSLSSSNPVILKFFVQSVYQLYGLPPSQLTCDLHLRMDQDQESLKKYWADTLGIPLKNFRSVSFDRRTAGTITKPSYRGVCVVYCGSIDIQRKLAALAELYCERVAADIINKGN